MRPYKLLTVGLWVLVFAVAGAFAVVYATAPDRPPQVGVAVPYEQVFDEADDTLPVLFDAPAFELTDQNGEVFSSDQLRGKVWVGFIFLTNCPTAACPVMSGKMAALQEALPDERVHFVSFSIDPERDAPAVLKGYADQMAGGEASDRWHLLTGDDRDEIRAVAKGLRLTFDDSNRHSTFFLLVDADGKVRGSYGNTDETAMARLRRDAQSLLATDGH